MKITSEKDQQSQVIVRIEIDPTELDEAKGRAAKRLSNQLRIPGFRPGKAPRALVERFAGPEMLLEQATRDLLPKAYKNALQDQDIKPIADPEYNIESTDPLVIVATIPVEPTVELGDYKSIKFDMPTVEVNEEDIQQVVDQLVDQQSTWEEPETERPVQEGDQVELEMQTIRDGEPGGEPFQRTGIVGKGELLAQIDEQIRGLNIGEEKTVEVQRQTATKPAEAETGDKTEGEDEEGAEAAPEQKAETDTEQATPDLPEVETLPLEDEEEDKTPMVFRVKVNSIKVKHSPEVNDEFAQSVTDVQTVDELRDRIRKNLENQRDNNNKREMTEKIIKEAVALSTIQMPPVLVNAEIHALEQNMAERLKQQKLSLDQYLQFMGKDHEAFHEELRPQAEDRIKTALVLREIARAEGITVEQGELDREVEKMVDEYTLNATEEERDERKTQMRGFLNQEQTRSEIENQIFSRKLSERLLELATGIKPQTEEEDVTVIEAEGEPVEAVAQAEELTAQAETVEDEAATPEVIGEGEIEGQTDQPDKK